LYENAKIASYYALGQYDRIAEEMLSGGDYSLT